MKEDLWAFLDFAVLKGDLWPFLDFAVLKGKLWVFLEFQVCPALSRSVQLYSVLSSSVQGHGIEDPELEEGEWCEGPADLVCAVVYEYQQYQMEACESHATCLPVMTYNSRVLLRPGGCQVLFLLEPLAFRPVRLRNPLKTQRRRHLSLKGLKRQPPTSPKAKTTQTVTLLMQDNCSIPWRWGRTALVLRGECA